VTLKTKWNVIIKFRCKIWKNREPEPSKRSKRRSGRECSSWWSSSRCLVNYTCISKRWAIATTSEREVKSSEILQQKLQSTKATKVRFSMALVPPWTTEHQQLTRMPSPTPQQTTWREQNCLRTRWIYQRETSLYNLKHFQILKSSRLIRFGKRMITRGLTTELNFRY